MNLDNSGEQDDEPRASLAQANVPYEGSDAAIVTLVICDQAGVIRYSVKTERTSTGLSNDNLIGSNLAAVSGLMLSDLQRSRLLLVVRQVATGNSGEAIVFSAPDSSGVERVFEFQISPLQGSDELLCSVIVRDLTLQKPAQEFSAEQRSILEMITRAIPSNEIFESISRLLEKHLPGALCSIQILDSEKRIQHVACHSLPKAFCEALDGTTIGPEVGSCGTAAYLGETVIVTDIAVSRLWQNYRHIALKYGLQSCWSTPLRGADYAVVGTIAIYYRHPHGPVSSEVALVDTVSHLAALAITSEQVNERIRESERRFRSVLEYSLDAHYRCDLIRGEVEYVSPAITEVTGFSIEEYVDLKVEGVLARIHPEDMPAVQKALAGAKASIAKSGNMEYRWRDKAGTYRWLSNRFTEHCGKNDESLFRVGSLQDISARKEAEAKLRSSNDRYNRQHTALTSLTRSQVLQTADLAETFREIAETVSNVVNVERVSIWRFAEGGTCIRCSELFERSIDTHSVGYELREETYPAYFRAMAETELISANDARTDPRTCEFTDNYLVPLNILSMLDAPLLLAGVLEGVLCLEQVGEPREWTYDEQLFVVSIANLVSLVLSKWELSRAEKVIRESETNLVNAQRIAHLGSWSWNIITGDQRWSAEVFRLLGYQPGEVVPAHQWFLDRVHPDDVTAVKGVVNTTIEAGSVYEQEYRVIWPGGEELILREQAEVIRNETGEPVEIYGTILDITRRKRAEERLLYNALHDGLTGLANRSLIYDQINTAFHRFKRHPERPFALILADLDRFKNVNDTLGHPVGDQVLQESARRISQTARDEDTVARLGGDEFAVLLEDLPGEDDSTRVAQRILDAMDRPFLIGDVEIDVGVSLGIVVVTDIHTSAEQVISDADIALYRAKNAGRGRYQIFDQEMHRRIVERLELEAHLRRAIERNELSLYLQPIISLMSGAIVSFEALLRWKHPVKGFISPAVFIPIAEETKLILSIGDWVAREACSLIQNWPGPSKPPISINVSPAQMLSTKPASIEDSEPAKQWDETLAATASEAQLDPAMLGIEVTESVLIGDPDFVRQLLDRLAARGFRLLMDDFGTGYSALSYLQDLPFSQVKLDAAFTAKLKPDTRSHELMRGIITLAHNLGIQVIAEGVETEEQLSLLRAASCDQVQGYLISHPLPVQQAQELYHSGRLW